MPSRGPDLENKVSCILYCIKINSRILFRTVNSNFQTENFLVFKEDSYEIPELPA